eukprot:SM000117S25522  [mRNA]  locus=s117:251572:256532:- [translate_table: standard]
MVAAVAAPQQNGAVANGGAPAVAGGVQLLSLKDMSAYSPLQAERLQYKPPLPAVLLQDSRLAVGKPTTAAGNADSIARLFPHLYGQPSVQLAAGQSDLAHPPPVLSIGVVLSGGQAPGGHNVIAGVFDYLQSKAPGSQLVGFLGGPAGIMKCRTIEITSEYLFPFRNQGGFDIICSGRDKIETLEQFQQAEATVKKLDLDGLVVIGGDDSNTNACLLAEYFAVRNMKTKVIGCPKTIDGDLKSKEVPISFGFDTACKIYSEMIGNIMLDARSAGKYYHVVRLMGRAASHVTLECALQTHPNVALIGEESSSSLLAPGLEYFHEYCFVVNDSRILVVELVCLARLPTFWADHQQNDLLIQHLIAELNEILAAGHCDQEGQWKAGLTEVSRLLYESLPQTIQKQLLLDRDPHGNVQVTKIDTEKMLIEMMETELLSRCTAGSFGGKFSAQSHFFGYEGRCGMPSNFDATYCYSLGFAAGALVQYGKTGLIASVGNLTAPVAEWTVGGTALTSLMDVERRKGKDKPVIKKAMVELDGAPFVEFAAKREQWAVKDCYRSPGEQLSRGRSIPVTESIRTLAYCPVPFLQASNWVSQWYKSATLMSN